MKTDTYTAMLAMQAYMSGALSRRALRRRIGRDGMEQLMGALFCAIDTAPREPDRAPYETQTIEDLLDEMENDAARTYA